MDRTILIRNPKAKVSIAASYDLANAALEHLNGKVYQPSAKTVDMILYDGSKKIGDGDNAMWVSICTKI